MITKSHIYQLASDIMPPILLRGLKKTALYQWLGSTLVRYSGKTPENITIQKGYLTGVTLTLDPNGPWQQEMLAGTYDHELFDAIKHVLTPGSVAYDIGAHIGYHSLVFAQLIGERGVVHAFEPNPANVARAEEILTKNEGLKKRITVHGVALGDTVGESTFFSSSDIESGISTGGFIATASTLWERERYTEGIGFKPSTVALQTLDALVLGGALPPPTFMKIDVEGAEQLVLKGAKDTLEKYRPSIVVEFHSIYSAFACMKELFPLYKKFTELKTESDGRIMIFVQP